MTLRETALLLEHKMYQLDLETLSEKVNANYRKNGGMEEISYKMNCNWDQMLSVKVEANRKETGHNTTVDHL